MRFKRFGLAQGAFASLVATLGVGALAAGVLAPPALAAPGDGVLTVKVIRDLNANGLADANEASVAGIPVQLIDAAGNRVDGVTDANGEAGFAPSAALSGGRYRVEASIPEALDYLAPAYIATDATGPTAFVPLTTTVDISRGDATSITMGVWNPKDYVGTGEGVGNPELVTVQGWSYDFPQTPVSGTNTHAVMKFRYDDRIDKPDHTTLAKSGDDALALSGQVGGVWGVASNGSDQLYVSSYNRFGIPAGPGGRGAIYKVDGSGTSSVEVFATVANYGGDWVTPSPFSAAAQQTSPDSDGLHRSIGREGLGDLDISENGDRLFAVNLNTRSLVVIPINADGSAGAQQSVPIPDPGCAASGDWRPWGLGVKDNRLFVGGVCSGETSGDAADLRAFVYRVDAKNPVFSPGAIVVSHGLDMLRGTGAAEQEFNAFGQCDPGYNAFGWEAWTDDFAKWRTCNNDFSQHESPLLSDIEFQDDGSLVLGFKNRSSMQAGMAAWGPDGKPRSYFGDLGDITKVCKVGGAYVWEDEAGCPIGPAQGGANSARPHGQEREFFSGDYYHAGYDEFDYGGPGTPEHAEVTSGGIAVVPGHEYLLTSAADPRQFAGSVTATQGVRWLSNTTGWQPGAGVLEDSRVSGVEFQDWPYSGRGAFTKAMSMGDISVLSLDAPLQIGNYVWHDTDQDGVQDPGEASIAGATVNLYAVDAAGNPTGDPIATVATNDRGEYYFDSISHGIEPHTQYAVVMDKASDYENGGPLEGLKPTKSDTGMATIAGQDVNDSDGVADAQGYPVARVTTGSEGRNDHDVDFGFITPIEIDVEKGDTGYEGDGDIANDADTIDDAAGYKPGETRTIKFEVANTNAVPLEKVVVTDQTISGGTVAALSCDFPGDAAPTVAVQDGTTWTARWDASFAGAKWQPGESFSCSAQLTVSGTADPHTDRVKVNAEVTGSGVPVEGEDDYHAFSGALQIIKYDDRNSDYTPATETVNGLDIPKKPLGNTKIDANTLGSAVEYPIADGQTTTGKQRVEVAVTNTGSTSIGDVTISDETLDAPAMTDLSCTFPDGSAGLTWNGVWKPGVTFYCEGFVELEAAGTHGDEVTVEGTVLKPTANPGYDPKDPNSNPYLHEDEVPDGTPREPSDIKVSDDDPFWAKTPQVSIEKGDTGEEDGDSIVNDADSAADASAYDPEGETRTILFEVKNNGDKELKNIVVTDKTVTGGTIQALSCEFPRAGAVAGVAGGAGDSWAATWAATLAGDGQTPADTWKPGESFTCHATLTLAKGDSPHADTASVNANFLTGGDPLQDEDDYHAFPGNVGVIKWDGRSAGPANASGGSKAGFDPKVDADTAANTVEYEIAEGADNTGKKPVKWVVTNTTDVPLYDVIVKDTTASGPALEDVTCTFPGESAPTSGAFDGDKGWTIVWAASRALSGGKATTVFEPGASFFCEGTVTLGPNEKHADTASVDAGVINSTTREPTTDRVTGKDPFNASAPASKTDIDKQDEQGNDADNAETAEGYAPGESRELKFTVKNTAAEDLVKVVVSDKLISGAEVTGMSCAFPRTMAPTAGVQNGSNWTVSWAESFTGDTWRASEAFECTAQLRVSGNDDPHVDVASVSASIAATGESVPDKTDEYHAFSGKVQIIKYDDREDAFTPGAGGAPTKPLPFPEDVRDANTEQTAVQYTQRSGAQGSGRQRVEFAVSNTGKTSLTDVSISDDTLKGNAMEDISCDFAPAGGPATGTAWNGGVWLPGVTFYCEGYVAVDADEQVHGDNAKVDATVLKPIANPSYDPNDPTSKPYLPESDVPNGTPREPSTIKVADEDPFWAELAPKFDVAWNKVAAGTGKMLGGSEWTVTRLDGNGEELAGTRVAIDDCAAASVSECLGPDKDPAKGQFRLENIDLGSYVLKETKAPAGYRLMGPKTFEITGDETEYTLVLGDLENQLQDVPNIPLTGGIGADQIYLAGGIFLTLIAAASGWNARRKRRSLLDG